MLSSLWNICFSVSASCQRPCDSYHMQLLGQRGHWPTLPLRKLCLIGKLANYKLSLISFVIVITCSCCGRGGIGPLCHNSHNYSWVLHWFDWVTLMVTWGHLGHYLGTTWGWLGDDLGTTLAKLGKTLAYSGTLWHTLPYSGRGHFLLIQYRFVFVIVLLLHKTHDYFQWPSNKRALYTLYNLLCSANWKLSCGGKLYLAFFFMSVGNWKGETEEDILHEVHFL